MHEQQVLLGESRNESALMEDVSAIIIASKDDAYQLKPARA
jgi:hypothetical protein